MNAAQERLVKTSDLPAFGIPRLLDHFSSAPARSRSRLSFAARRARPISEERIIQRLRVAA